MDASQIETEQVNQINLLAKRFSAHQKALGLTDARFAARYEQYLGSHKTWLKLKDGTWPGHVSATRILDKLKKFSDVLEGSRSFDVELFNPNLPYITEMDANFQRLLASPLDIRGLISLAPQGVGKSWWASALRNRDPEALHYYLRLLFSHREKGYQIALAITEKLGGSRTRNPADQWPETIRHAKSLGEFVLILDEAHNGGIVLFKMLKDLIDETSMRFVYLGFPTEFDVIVGRSTSAIGESRQTLRRCLQPIHDDYRDGIMARDVEAYLVGQGFRRNGELREVAQEIQPMITARYNLTTLATAMRDARKEADDRNIDLTLGLVTTAVKSLCSTPNQRREAMRQAQQQQEGK